MPYRVDKDVAKEHAAEQQVALLAERVDLGSPPLLVLGANLHHNGELLGVERHQPEVEPREEAGETEENGDNRPLGLVRKRGGVFARGLVM